MVLCACGCGEEVKEGNTFICGHGRRGKEYWKSQEEPQLCECGCGEYANPGRKFIIYHHSRGKNYHEKQKQQLCECGCGKLANPGRRFINGHYRLEENKVLKAETHPSYNINITKWVNDNQNKHLCKCGCGEYIIIRRNHYNSGIPKYILGHYAKMVPSPNQEIRDKISKSNTGKVRTKEMREHSSIMTTKYFEDITNRKKLSAIKQGITYDEWEGFASESLYCPSFNETCKESNREKYDRKCFICGLPESENIASTGKQKKLSVHHIDMDKMQGCDGKRWKLVPTCMWCHNNLHTKLWEFRIIWLLKNIYNKEI